jgi:RNA polymerase sigma-70 factor, ECF subfamily
MYNEPLVDA